MAKENGSHEKLKNLASSIEIDRNNKRIEFEKYIEKLNKFLKDQETGLICAKEKTNLWQCVEKNSHSFLSCLNEIECLENCINKVDQAC